MLNVSNFQLYIMTFGVLHDYELNPLPSYSRWAH